MMLNSLIFFVFFLFLTPVYAQQPPVKPVPDPNAHPLATLCAIAAFGDPNTKGPLWPETGPLAEGKKDKILYGTSPEGGEHGYGTIFKVTTDGQLSVVHSFNFTDGSSPKSGLTVDAQGVFTGACYAGGALGFGNVFTMPPGGGKPEPACSFRNGKPHRVLRPGEKDYTDQEKLNWGSSYPIGAPVAGVGVSSYFNNQKGGVFYSVGGGDDGCAGIQRFTLETGVYPISLTMALDGHIYGAALGTAGLYPGGTIFQADGGIKPLHIFKGGAQDGSNPLSVTFASDGYLYGSTPLGGVDNDRGPGLLYQLSTDGKNFTIIHMFDSTGGSVPMMSPIEGGDGKLYGTARFGGRFGRGVAYRVDKDGKNFEVLEPFDFKNTGRSPMSALIQHSDGNFYGTTYEGGKFGKGVVFRLNVKPKQAYQLKDPGSNFCCSLGQKTYVNGYGYGGDSLDPDHLGGHVYGWKDVAGSFTELTPGTIFSDRPPIGYVYTMHASLVDIGHVRDNADMVSHVYDLLLAGQTEFDLYEGHVMITHFPADQYQALDLAAAITYVEGWAHELATWGTGVDQSSFSAEDLVSNMVGIEIGKRAITNECAIDFSKAVDIEMPIMMKELGAQPIAVTDHARDLIEQKEGQDAHDKWFRRTKDDEPGSHFHEMPIRRNFDGMPWKILPDKDRFIPLWLEKRWFQTQTPNFSYGLWHPVDGRAGISLKNMPSETQRLREQWKAEHPKMDIWPYNW